MEKQTIYTKVNYDAEAYDGEMRNGIKLLKKEAYVLTEEELRELLSNSFDAVIEYGNPHLEGTPETKEQYINSIVK